MRIDQEMRVAITDGSGFPNIATALITPGSASPAEHAGEQRCPLADPDTSMAGRVGIEPTPRDYESCALVTDRRVTLNSVPNTVMIITLEP